MAISAVKQYSVFLENALSQDVRFDSAVIRVATNYNAQISHALTKAGFTSVKTDAICVDTADRVGVVRDIGDTLQKKNINITTIYGSSTGNGKTRFIVVVSDIAQALNALESSGLF